MILFGNWLYFGWFSIYIVTFGRKGCVHNTICAIIWSESQCLNVFMWSPFSPKRDYKTWNHWENSGTEWRGEGSEQQETRTLGLLCYVLLVWGVLYRFISWKHARYKMPGELRLTYIKTCMAYLSSNCYYSCVICYYVGTRYKGIDGSARIHKFLSKKTPKDYLVEKIYHLAQYLGPFGSYLMPQGPI